MKLPHVLSAIFLLSLAAVLSGCGGLDLKRASAKKSYRSLQDTVTNPDSPELAAVGELLKQAAKKSKRSPGQAIDLYLEAAERTLPGAMRGGAEAKYYRHATGQAVALLSAPRRLVGSSLPTRYKINDASGRNLLDRGQFDALDFVDTIETDNIEVVSQGGLGAPMICHMNWSSERAKQHPFLHEVGVSAAATAAIDFPSKGVARIYLYNTRRSDRTVFRGVNRTLAANFTAPLASSYDRRQAKLLGAKGILRPAAFFDQMGLYSTEVMDPSKIPVVFSHGLGSKPSTWIPPYNALLGEKFFRENYQVYGYYYPSGLPPIYPAAGLREELYRLHRELKKRGAGRNADRMVLVGHSMGGLMTSFQIRDFRGTANRMYTSPLRELPLAPRSRKAMITMLESPPPPFVKRAVFVATPHRGSTIANNWLGRFGSTLSKVPKQLLSLQVGEATRSLTTFGRALALDADPLDGIARLKAGNPMLTFTLTQPIAYGTPHHSIIGDRGKGGGTNRGDDPESTDGVVPYWSSHLESAVSEIIVPSHHAAHTHPKAHAELKRIFRLHLGR